MKNSRLWALLILIGLLATACGGDSQSDEDGEPISLPDSLPQQEQPLSEANSWGYQLQNIDPDQLAASPFDLLVVDYADNNSDPFAAEAIERVQTEGKIVLSYLSIGEAETYRPYWDAGWLAGDACNAPLSASAPDWLDPVNPDWCGNYAVKFWDPDWQTLVFAYVDDILAAGFDGVYLDKVDIFYYWLGEEDLGATQVYAQAAPAMADFVQAIADYARQRDPDFLIVPQNAAEIVEYLDATQQVDYLTTIDGIGIEDTFFPPVVGESGNNALYLPQRYVLDLLEVYQASGMPVFAVDYVTAQSKVERFYEEAQAHGFVPYATVRDLDTLTINAGFDD